MRLNRRQVLAGLAGTAMSAAPSLSMARTAIQMGGGEVVALSDGHLVLPGDFFFGHLPQDELAPVLAAHGVPRDQVEPPCNLTLLRQDGRIVLFDVGAGPAFMPSAGKLQASLAAEGLSPEDVTHVIFTHAHPDHLWGILDDFDEPLFANAQMMMGQAEWNYWTDPATVDTIGEARASFAVGAARRLAVVEDQMILIRGGEEVLPGIMAHDTPGHTPGHMAFEIRSGRDAVMVGGDAIGNGHVALARPDWANGADSDPELGTRTRLRLLDQLVADDVALLGFHLPGGGLGRVERNGDAYRFVPEST